jgi:hypothetical protein
LTFRGQTSQKIVVFRRHLEACANPSITTHNIIDPEQRERRARPVESGFLANCQVYGGMAWELDHELV